MENEQLRRKQLKDYLRANGVYFYNFFQLYGSARKKRPSEMTIKDVDDFLVVRQQDNWRHRLAIGEL